MTREAFIKALDKERDSYRMEGDKIVITYRGDVDLDSLKELPSGVEFSNGGSVDLDSLTSLPSGTEFRNKGSVWLESLTDLPPGVQFENMGNFYLKSLIGGWFHKWEGNIEGIDSKRLINKMISIGIFDRR